MYICGKFKSMKTEIINRPYYLDKVIPYIDENLIKVFIGQRRVGKSFIMKNVAQYIQNNVADSNIVFVDKEKMDFSFIKNAENLNDYVKSKIQTDKKNYLFVDEIQEIEKYELCLRSLLNDEVCDIYCSGSNAHILSGDLATHLSGRSIAIDVHSLSFKEFLMFKKLDATEESLYKYIKIGGMPYIAQLPDNEDVIYEYLKNIYSTILLKDIVTRQGIRNVPFLENLVLYLSDNIGNLFSVKNISDYLKSQKISISIPTVMDYLDGLAKAFLIYKVPRIDLNGLKVFEISEKYYFEDLGVRNALTGGYRPNDIAKVLENIVYKDLITRGYKVNVGYSKGYEVDFVATKKNEKVYIQVTYLLSSEKTIQREFSNLANIRDNYPKYVVSMDKFPVTSDYPGIIQIFMLDFLMKDKLSY